MQMVPKALEIGFFACVWPTGLEINGLQKQEPGKLWQNTEIVAIMIDM